MLSAKQARGEAKLGSESRRASHGRLSSPGFLMYAARHSQQIPDRVVDSIFKETLGKYVSNCKYSIVSVSDDYTVTWAGVGHLNLPDRFCLSNRKPGFSREEPRVREFY